jgi:membrane protein
MKPKDVVALLKETFRQWNEDNTSWLGAALAYYTVFALAPLAVVAVAIAGLVFGEQAARGELVHQAEEMVDPAVARALEDMLKQVHNTGSGVLATAVGFAVLLVGATSMFSQLQGALDTIWGVKPRPGRGILAVVRDRLLSFLVVLGVGALLLLCLAVNTALAALSSYLGPAGLPGEIWLWRILNWVISLGLLTLLFAMIYKVLPDVKISWGDVWVGSAITAVLFTLGNYLIGLYLGQAGVASAYGAAGSLVVILVWVYYSSQVLLFGAEFTQVFACKFGREIVPADNAVPLTAQARARQGSGCRPERA